MNVGRFNYLVKAAVLPVFLILSGCATAPSGAADKTQKLNLAIRWLLPDNVSQTERNNAELFIDMFETRIVNERTFKVYERKDIGILASERKEQLGGILSPEITSQYLSKGVTKLLSVVIKTIGGKLSFQIKLTDLENGEILLSEMLITAMDSGSLQDTAETMAKKLAKPFK